VLETRLDKDLDVVELIDTEELVDDSGVLEIVLKLEKLLEGIGVIENITETEDDPDSDTEPDIDTEYIELSENKPLDVFEGLAEYVIYEFEDRGVVDIETVYVFEYVYSGVFVLEIDGVFEENLDKELVGDIVDVRLICGELLIVTEPDDVLDNSGDLEDDTVLLVETVGETDTE